MDGIHYQDSLLNDFKLSTLEIKWGGKNPNRRKQRAVGTNQLQTPIDISYRTDLNT